MIRVTTKKQGFTLIELLIVVAIIGLLATLAIVGLTTAQQRARDVKRIGDIRNVQEALELYWNDNASYPTLVSPALDSWGEFSGAFFPYISQFPVDPYHTSSVSSLANTYVYSYLGQTQKYILGALLESSSVQALSQDVDFPSKGGGAWTLLTSKDTFTPAGSMSCNDPEYCVYGDSTD